MHEWVWVQEGSFPRCFILREHCVGWPVKQSSTSERTSLPFLPSSLSSLNLPSLQFSPVPRDRLSPGDPGCHTQSNCGSSFGITLLHWQTMWCSLTKGLHCQPHLTFPYASQQRTQPSFFPLGFWAWVLFSFMIFYHCKSGCGDVATLPFPGWK